MDYRALLVKYMSHIGDMEGTAFTGRYLNFGNLFTEEEKAELNKLEEESRHVPPSK